MPSDHQPPGQPVTATDRPDSPEPLPAAVLAVLALVLGAVAAAVSLGVLFVAAIGAAQACRTTPAPERLYVIAGVLACVDFLAPFLLCGRRHRALGVVVGLLAAAPVVVVVVRFVASRAQLSGFCF